MSDLSDRLASASDQLRSAIARADERLDELQLGVSARVALGDGRFLVYDRRESRVWGLIIESADGRREEDPKCWSRATLCLVAGRLDELHSTLIAAAKQLLAETLAATSEVCAFEDKLETK